MAVPLKVVNDTPVGELAGKIVLDTNNYMVWRDGRIPVIDSGEKTVHELRQEQLPTSKVAKAFTHIHAEHLLSASRPAGDPARVALAVSSNYPEAVELVARLYDRLGFDPQFETGEAHHSDVTPCLPGLRPTHDQTGTHHRKESSL